VNKVRQHEPDDIFFTWGESEGSSIFIVVEGGRRSVLIIVVDEFHDVEVFGNEVLSFSEEGIGQVEDVHFFEGLDDGSGSSSIDDSHDSFLFEFSFDGFVNNLQFGIEFLSIQLMFGRGVQQHFRNLIFSSIDIS